MGDQHSPLPLAGGAGGGPEGANSDLPTPNPSRKREGDYLRFRDDAAADEPAVSLDFFFEQPNAVSVRIEAGGTIRAGRSGVRVDDREHWITEFPADQPRGFPLVPVK